MAKTILITDDSASMRQLVSISLRGAGYEVIEACDGVDALDRLKGQKVNLVISDVNMPRMDGYDFVKALKQRQEYRFTPVIMLTTESDEGKKQAGKLAGAKAWIVKPFKPDQLLAAVASLVQP